MAADCAGAASPTDSRSKVANKKEKQQRQVWHLQPAQSFCPADHVDMTPLAHATQRRTPPDDINMQPLVYVQQMV
jgi:hypothetical protein